MDRRIELILLSLSLLWITISWTAPIFTDLSTTETTQTQPEISFFDDDFSEEVNETMTDDFDDDSDVTESSTVFSFEQVFTMPLDLMMFFNNETTTFSLTTENSVLNSTITVFDQIQQTPNENKTSMKR